MPFHNYFPWTALLYRKLSTRRARLILSSIGIALLAVMIAFRAESILFARRVHRILKGMQQIELNKTSEEELLKTIPDLQIDSVPAHITGAECPAQACYYFSDNNLEKVPIGLLFDSAGSRGDWIRKPAYLLGHRFYIFSVDVQVRDHRVSKWMYNIVLEDGKFSGYGGIIAGAGEMDHPSFLRRRDRVEHSDRLLEYEFAISRKYQESFLYLLFTPDAPRQFIKDAFDLRLSCMWNLTGCKTTRDVFPSAWVDWSKKQ